MLSNILIDNGGVGPVRSPVTSKLKRTFLDFGPESSKST